MSQLPIPQHYGPGQCFDAAYTGHGTEALFNAAMAWKAKHNIKPVGGDKKRVHALIIDDQHDFSFPEGTLFVSGRDGKGAMTAQQRAVEFLYKNLGVVSEITCTLDTHVPYQVFSPAAHVQADGTPVAPHTIISAEDYQKGRYRPSPAMVKQIGMGESWLTKQFTHYCEQLEKDGKYALYIWPYHCLLGSAGHQLSGVVEDARCFHAFTRGAANTPAVKGGNPLTENYSIFGPEVCTTFDGDPLPNSETNTQLIETLMKSDMVLLLGEAASHCVKESIAHLLHVIAKKDAALVRKCYIMTDCMASVVVPNGPDFTDAADAAIAEFVNAGMHAVESTTPIQDWPNSAIQ